MSSEPEESFEDWVREALDSLPPKLGQAVSNVEVLIEDGDLEHPGRLGLYHGIPLTRRSRGYLWALPDRITIYRGTLERLYGRDPARLKERVQHVVRHELAHHFGISDKRLHEIGRY
ncbi:MAG: metallopeptidase family protein [Actinomycetia bacterium]|nr:metallopeptidase family protein [Actinomycetes bacterium]